MSNRTGLDTPRPERICLLDLNYTLVSNSNKLGYPHHDRLYMEEYRAELVEAIRADYVILITVRPIEFKEPTLKRVLQKLNWQPNEAHFNEWWVRAPVAKERILNRYVFPKHGRAPERYYAVESNKDTRAMYAKYQIEAQHWNDFIFKTA